METKGSSKSHWDFRTLQHEICLMIFIAPLNVTGFFIESFMSNVSPEKRCARGLPMLHFCRLLCVAQEPFEIDDLCGAGPRVTGFDVAAGHGSALGS